MTHPSHVYSLLSCEEGLLSGMSLFEERSTTFLDFLGWISSYYNILDFQATFPLQVKTMPEAYSVQQDEEVVDESTESKDLAYENDDDDADDDLIQAIDQECVYKSCRSYLSCVFLIRNPV